MVFNERQAIDLAKDIYYTIIFREIGTLWFLPVLFVEEILFFVLKNRTRLDISITSLMLVFSILYT